MKSILETCMLWISHIKFDISSPTRLLFNFPKKSKTLASSTTPIQTTRKASVISTALAVSSSITPA